MSRHLDIVSTKLMSRQDKTKHFILSVHKYGNLRNDKYRYTKEANMCNDNVVLTC